MPPPRGTPANIHIHLVFPETGVIGLHFCRWYYGSVFIQIRAVGSKRRVFSTKQCVFTVQGHPRLMILIPIENGCATSISSSLWLWSYLAPFLRYGDLLAKKTIFSTLSHSAPSLPVFLLEFRGQVKRRRTILSEDPMIVAWVILTHFQRVTERRTDRQTEGRI